MFKIIAASLLVVSVGVVGSAPRVYLGGQTGDYTFGHVEALVPVVDNDCYLLFGDVQGYAYTNRGYALSAGGGFRTVGLANRFVLGGYGLYDWIRPTVGGHFSRLTVGGELLGCCWDARVNGYLPLGSRQRDRISKFVAPVQTGCRTPTPFFMLPGAFFDGERIAVNGDELFDSIQGGFDVEVGHVVPKFCKLRAYVGYYHYWRSGLADRFDGVKVRCEYRVTPNFTILATERYDRAFKNRFTIGMRFGFGGGCHKGCLSDRLTDPIVRDNDLRPRIVGRTVEVASQNIIFVNNANGQAGDGTLDNPFQSLTDGLFSAGRGDVVYIFEGTGDPYQIGQVPLQQGQVIFGSGGDFKVGGQVVLPASGTPIIDGAFALGNELWLTNFNMDSSGTVATAIVGANTRANTLQQIGISNYLTSGVDLSSGSCHSLFDVSVDNTGATGINLSDGTSPLFIGGTISNITGTGLLADNGDGADFRQITISQITGVGASLMSGVSHNVHQLNVANVVGMGARGVVVSQTVQGRFVDIIVDNIQGDGAVGFVGDGAINTVVAIVNISDVAGEVATGATFIGAENVSFKGVVIDQVDGQMGSGIGLDIGNSQQFTLDAAAISNIMGTPATGLSGIGAVGALISDLTVTNVIGSTGIDLSSGTGNTISSTTVSNVVAGAGLPATGIRADDAVDHSQTNVDVMQILGGGDAKGIAASNATNFSYTGGRVEQVTGGVGANANGIAILANKLKLKDLTIDRITGGDGVAGSDGGFAGGIACENSQAVVGDSLTVTNIVGGRGGDGVGNGGAGGQGRQAEGILAGGADSLIFSNCAVDQVRGGDGGNGFVGTAVDPDGGNGGMGGRAAGIGLQSAKNCEVVSSTLLNLQGGGGGDGGDATALVAAGSQAAGNGGNGGHARGITATAADGIAVHETTASSLFAGVGGNGGASRSDAGITGTAGGGGQGEVAIGFDLEGAVPVAEFTTTSAHNLFGGAGGSGGSGEDISGGNGGNGGIGCGFNFTNGVTFDGGASDVTATNLNGGMGGGGGALTGTTTAETAGSGGTGGAVIGIDLSNNVDQTLTNLTLDRLHGGPGGVGGVGQGAGGVGGVAVGVRAPDLNGGTFSNALITSIRGGGGGFGGIGSDTSNPRGGAGSNGGSAAAFELNAPAGVVTVEKLEITTIVGGLGGAGGRATAVGQTPRDGGAGGDGGEATGLLATNPGGTLNITDGTIALVTAGDGHAGGQAFPATTTDIAGIGGAGGGGDGLRVTGTMTGQVNVSDIQAEHIFGGNGGSGGQTADANGVDGGTGGAANGVFLNQLGGESIVNTGAGTITGGDGGRNSFVDATGAVGVPLVSGATGVGGEARGVSATNASGFSLGGIGVDGVTGGDGGMPNDPTDSINTVAGAAGGSGGNATGLFIDPIDRVDAVAIGTIQNITGGSGADGINATLVSGSGLVAFGGGGGNGGPAVGFFVDQIGVGSFGGPSVNTVTSGPGGNAGRTTNEDLGGPVISGASGGSGGLACGFVVENSNVTVSDISISDIIGAQGGLGASVIGAGDSTNATGGSGGAGGSADGFRLISTNDGILGSGNVVGTITAGAGASGGAVATGNGGTGGDGGDGFGLSRKPSSIIDNATFTGPFSPGTGGPGGGGAVVGTPGSSGSSGSVQTLP